MIMLLLVLLWVILMALLLVLAQLVQHIVVMIFINISYLLDGQVQLLVLTQIIILQRHLHGDKKLLFGYDLSWMLSRTFTWLRV